ncbi:MAG: serine/threonine-protein kinase [Bacteroidota bacterium]
MPASSWDHLGDRFAGALARPADAREALLAEACDDEAVRAEVRELLAAHAADGPVDRLGAAWTPAADVLDVPAAPPEAEVAGRRIGPYRVMRRLGRGGMGEVFLAERADGQFERQVALKLLRDGIDSASARARFLHERQTLARLEHPGIARLLDGGLTDDGRPFFAMEAVAGERIDRYCDRHRLDVGARLRLFGQVCEAVHHAHQRLVVHRDLKPSNVLVAGGMGDEGLGIGEGSERATAQGLSPQSPIPNPRSPRVKLLDFGIATLIEDTGGDAETMTRLLTPEYAAPEQIAGGEVSTATDVYALGVVLYELLTGVRPFALADLPPGEVVRAICETAPPAPSTAVTGTLGDPEAVEAFPTDPATRARRLRGDLDTICLTALDKDPARRYASAEAFLADVQRHLDGRPIQARPASVGYRARKFVGRHRLGVAASMAGLLTLVGALGGMTWQAREAAAERDRARTEAAKAEQVSAFLRSLLTPIDSFEAGVSVGDPDLPVADVVRRAAATVERDLAGRPAVLATVHQTLGAAFGGLGRLDEAEPHLRRALALHDSLHAGLPHPDRIRSLDDLATLHSLRQEWADAEAVQRRAADLRRARFGAGSLELAASYVALVGQSPFQLRGERATALLNEAWAIWDAAGDSRIELAHGLRLALAIDHLENRRFAEADSAFAALADDLPRYAPGDDLRRAEVLHHWAAVGILDGNLEAAEARSAAALAILHRQLDPAHPNLAIATALQAPILLDRGEAAAAEALLRPAAEILRETVPASWSTFVINAELGAARGAQGDDVEAESLLVANLRAHRAGLGDRHHWVPHIARRLVAFYDARGRTVEAAPYRRLLPPP